MRVVRWDNDGPPNRREYRTDMTNIREVAMEFGRANDTLELYDDDDNLVAVAAWPVCSRAYMYCTGKNLSPYEPHRVFGY